MAMEESLIRTPPRPSFWQRSWKNLSLVFESRIATVGLIIGVFWVIVGIISFIWTPFPENANAFVQNLPPSNVFLISFVIVAAGIIGLALSNLNRNIKIAGMALMVLA
ncbi:MAG TPA: hypothetical protein VFI27_07460, partial [candidate division Zixibacteria bacterium]|nr:hypothetical protein [candidate division Zixibacteria bacterium]